MEEDQTAETPLENVNSEGPPTTSSRTNTSSPEMLAEVVLLRTSLGGVKKQNFESQRAQHLLDCKGLVYYLVDANKDISDATDFKDRDLFESWRSQGFLRLFKDESGNENVVLPQVIIDGISVGDQKFLQDLEDDGDLDYIVARLLCPSCLSEKGPEVVSCPNCKVEYRNIIPDEYIDNSTIRKFCQGYPC